MRAIRDVTGRKPAASQYVQNPSVWRSVDDIDADAWNSIRDPDDLFMDLRLLKLVESTIGDQTELWYILIRDTTGKPAGIACLYTFTPDAFMMAKNCWSIRIQKQIQRVLPGLFAHKVLACGMPLSAAQNYLRLAPSADHTEVLETLDALMLEIGRDVGAKYVMLKEFSDDDTACQEQLPNLGYRRAESLPQNISRPQQSTFEEFVKHSLSSKDRSSIRKSQQKTDDAGVVTRFTSDAMEISQLFTARVHSLYAAVFNKAKRKLEWLPAEFFCELPRQLPEQTSFCFLLKDGEVLAFIASIYSKTTFYPLFVGVDYDRNPQYDLYFNVMFQSFSSGLARNVEFVEAGQTSDFFKGHKLDCQQSRRYIFIKGTSRFMQWLMNLQFDKTFPQQSLLSEA